MSFLQKNKNLLISIGLVGLFTLSLKDKYTPNPRYSPIFYHYGEKAVRKGIFKKAERFFQNAIYHDPNFGLGEYGLGLLYKKIGKYDLAKNHFEMAVYRNPKLHQAYFELGIYHFIEENYKLAQGYFTNALQFDGLSTYYYLLGLTYLYLGNKQMAIGQWGIIKGAKVFDLADEIEQGIIELEKNSSPNSESTISSMSEALH